MLHDDMNHLDHMCRKLGIANPWQDGLEILPFDKHGWFDECSIQGLLEAREELVNIKFILELGSWIGKSTRFLADISELVVAVDHWQGSAEHQDTSREDVVIRLPTLYQQFMSNCRPKSNKILPLKMSTSAAFELFRRKGLQGTFDLIYVDAAHDRESVLHDLTHSMRMISTDGVICGDDWNWWGKEAPVRREVESFARMNKLGITTNGDFWRLKNRR